MPRRNQVRISETHHEGYIHFKAVVGKFYNGEWIGGGNSIGQVHVSKSVGDPLIWLVDRSPFHQDIIDYGTTFDDAAEKAHEYILEVARPHVRGKIQLVDNTSFRKTESDLESTPQS